jgi:hypothetical protein
MMLDVGGAVRVVGGAVVVVDAVVVLVLEFAAAPWAAFVVPGPRVTRAVIDTAAPARIRTITTIIQPLSLAPGCSRSSAMA